MISSYFRPFLAFLAIFALAGGSSALTEMQAPQGQPAMLITRPANGEIFSTAPILVTLKLSDGADPEKMHSTLNGRDVTQFFRPLTQHSLQAGLPVYVLASGSNLFKATDGSLEATVQFSFQPPPATPPAGLGAPRLEGAHMSNVQDVLQGQDFLMRDDDLVVIMQGAVPGCQGCPITYVWTLPTQNSNFTGAQNQIFSAQPSSNVVPFNLSSGAAAATALGRLYSTSNDVVLTLVPGAESWKLNLVDTATSYQNTSKIPSEFQPTGAIYTQMVMGDFTGDGLDSALLLYASPGPQTQVGMTIATASDVNIPDSAVQFGPEYYLGTTNSTPTIETVVAGDFNGDGGAEIAALMTDNQTVQFFTVDPLTLQITPAGSVTLPHPLYPNALAAGRFRNRVNDEVIATGQVVGGPSGQTLDAIHITANPATGSFKPAISPEQFVFTSPPILKILAQAASIEASFVTPPQAGATAQDQLVMITDNSSNGGNLEIGSFDPNFNFMYQSDTNVTDGDAGCVYSMAIGNFDKHYADGTRIPNLQVATYWTYNSNDCAVGSANAPSQIRIWDITPNPSSDGNHGGNWLGSSYVSQIVTPNIHGLQMLNMVPGDTQGRSLRLGSPEKITVIGQLQPDLVLGMPPMQIDWIKPNNDILAQAPGCNNDVTTPCLVNLTVKPSVPSPSIGFATGFNFQSSTGNSEEQKSTTSWGVSVKTTFEQKVEAGLPDVGEISNDVKDSAKYSHDSEVSKTYNTYTGQSTSLSITTGFADHLFFTEQNENIYYYPVLGQSACPQDNPACPDSEKVPLYVDFSVPSQVTENDMDGTLLDWYQPVHEPGNIFSYPWSLPLMQQQFSSGLTPLTENPPTCMATDSASQTYKDDWTINQGESNSSASSNAFSNDLSVSYSFKVGGEAVGASGQISFGVDIGNSVSLKTLNVSTQNQSASKGVTVTVPNFDSDVAQCCAYGFASYILGTPNTTFQSPADLGIDTSNFNVATTGPMYVEFLADPVPDASGLTCGGNSPWWKQVYDLPDVGLNHSAQWGWEKSNQTASFNYVNPSLSPAVDPFYWMKGFFITEANDAGKGPNLGMATAGDQLTLTARVYNFSLVDTNDPTLADPAASIPVVFYGQNYCSSGLETEASCVDQNGQTCNAGELCGNAFNIGESAIGSIPGFKSVTTQPPESIPNWTTTSVNFDTTGHANSNLVFWVVVWMEDANGNLVPEMPSHGLTANPEGMTFTQISQVPFEPYSNNVGLYDAHSPFFVAPASAAASKARPARPQSVSLTLPSTPILLDQMTPIKFTVGAGAGPTDPVSVALYDGNPTDGGKLEDLQSTAPVAAGSSYTNRLYYQPASCGRHTLVAVAQTTDFPSVLGNTTLYVTTNPLADIAALATSTQSAKMSDALRDRLLRILTRARTFFEKGETSRGESCVRDFIRLVEEQLPADVADSLISQAKTILTCL